jgi:hypothetical protein
MGWRPWSQTLQIETMRKLLGVPGAAGQQAEQLGVPLRELAAKLVLPWSHGLVTRAARVAHPRRSVGSRAALTPGPSPALGRGEDCSQRGPMGSGVTARRRCVDGAWGYRGKGWLTNAPTARNCPHPDAACAASTLSRLRERVYSSGTRNFREPVERAGDAQGVLARHVRVDHGGLHILVPKQCLDGADVVAILQQVSGEAVTQGMR